MDFSDSKKRMLNEERKTINASAGKGFPYTLFLEH